MHAHTEQQIRVCVSLSSFQNQFVENLEQVLCAHIWAGQRMGTLPPQARVTTAMTGPRGWEPAAQGPGLFRETGRPCLAVPRRRLNGEPAGQGEGPGVRRRRKKLWGSRGVTHLRTTAPHLGCRCQPAGPLRVWAHVGAGRVSGLEVNGVPPALVPSG